MTGSSLHVNAPITDILRKDVARLRHGSTVQQALEAIRRQGLGERIVYFYVVDDNDRLVGVLPTRRLLTALPQEPISALMLAGVIAIPQQATIFETYEYFLRHKFLAFPVVDEHHRLLGVVDIGMFTDETIDAADQANMNRIFEMIGFRILQVEEASPWRAFRFRFPWLLATISSGTVCALLAGIYEMTLARSLILAFFLTLVLGLGESVSIQSMTLIIHNLRSKQPDWAWYMRTICREVGEAVLLGAACGLVVGLIAWLWRGEGVAALTIGASILLTLCAAVFFGLSVPSLLHTLKLDMRIAAGPLTLALTDIATILIYFSLAELLL